MYTRSSFESSYPVFPPRLSALMPPVSTPLAFSQSQNLGLCAPPALFPPFVFNHPRTLSFFISPLTPYPSIIPALLSKKPGVPPNRTDCQSLATFFSRGTHRESRNTPSHWSLVTGHSLLTSHGSPVTTHVPVCSSSPFPVNFSENA